MTVPDLDLDEATRSDEPLPRYPEPTPPDGPLWPAGPPAETERWPDGPTTWPRLDLPDEPVDSTTLVSRSAAIGAVVGTVAAAILLFAFGWLTGDGDGGDEADVTAGTTTTLPVPGGALDIGAVIEAVRPSVVSLQIEARDNPVFGGAGSGIILEEDGLILTNAHVVAGATEIDVGFSDGRVAEAIVLGSLPGDDVALIKARGVSGLVPAQLGSSAELEVGDDVVAIGNAFNLGGEPSVTSGIVSAKNRSIAGPGYALTGLIQTDAAINPGNSGGPLVNRFGQVVGVNTAIIDQSQNVGFAIGIDVVAPLIDDIQAGHGEGSPDDASLGAFGSDVAALDAAERDAFGVTAEAGGFVEDVNDGSAAAEAGLQLADVITRIGGVPVTSWADVEAQVLARKPGDAMSITVERFGEPLTLTVTLDRRGG